MSRFGKLTLRIYAKVHPKVTQNRYKTDPGVPRAPLWFKRLSIPGWPRRRPAHTHTLSIVYDDLGSHNCPAGFQKRSWHQSILYQSTILYDETDTNITAWRRLARYLYLFSVSLSSGSQNVRQQGCILHFACRDLIVSAPVRP